MRCRKPRTVGFQSDGKTIAWSQKNYSKEYPTFQLPCGKCRFCRLEYARSWAIRSVHEAAIHDQNCFITLTYNEDHLESEKLVYDDFQAFIRSLRDYLRDTNQEKEIGYIVVGEYGEKNKRPHWHACLFNYRPDDPEYLFSNDLGDKVYTSKFLTDLWGKGHVSYGDVSFHSAGYIARYSLKKTKDHGKAAYDGEDFQPIFKSSRKYAIGKRWLEKYWEDVFNYGQVILKKADGTVTKCGIPRYYKKWLRENHWDAYLRYLSEVQNPQAQKAEKKAREEYLKNVEINGKNPLTPTRHEIEHEVLEQTIKNRLQNYRKL